MEQAKPTDTSNDSDSNRASNAVIDRRVFQLRALVLVIVGLGFVGGLAIGRVGVRQTWEAWQSSNWARVSGVITSADTSFATQTQTVDKREGRTIRGQREVKTEVWSPRLTYSFEVDGQKHEGHRIAVADVASDTYSDATDVVKRYAVDTPVTVYIHPTDPTRSVLEPGITFGAVGPIIIGAVLCFCMASMAYGVMSKTFVSLVDGFRKPPGSYLVGEDGRLAPLKRKGKQQKEQDGKDSRGST